MRDERTQHWLHRFFEVGVLLKGLNALVELASGFLLLFVDVRSLILALTQDEIIEDPNDFLASHLRALAGHITAGGEYYSALYLISHGLIKGILVWGLLRGKLWAYPASLAVLALFIVYQTINFVGTHSMPMLLLTIFDLVIVLLIWHEYRFVKGKQSAIQ